MLKRLFVATALSTPLFSQAFEAPKDRQRPVLPSRYTVSGKLTPVRNAGNLLLGQNADQFVKIKPAGQPVEMSVSFIKDRLNPDLARLVELNFRLGDAESIDLLSGVTSLAEVNPTDGQFTERSLAFDHNNMTIKFSHIEAPTVVRGQTMTYQCPDKETRDIIGQRKGCFGIACLGTSTKFLVEHYRGAKAVTGTVRTTRDYIKVEFIDGMTGKVLAQIEGESQFYKEMTQVSSSGPCVYEIAPYKSYTTAQ